jgi:hypothetical protein
MEQDVVLYYHITPYKLNIQIIYKLQHKGHLLLYCHIHHGGHELSVKNENELTALFSKGVPCK